MDMSKWQKCEVDTVDFSGATLWIGGDLSMTTDLTSVGWVGMDDEG
ncbi:terminase large subunit [Bacillus phage FI_KG-Lek]|nr:terminase large subunit [Bacillus phage FI_KG-Lek]